MFQLLEDQIDNIKSLVLLSSLNLVYMLGLASFSESLLVEGTNKFFLIVSFFPIHLLFFSDSEILLIVKCITILYMLSGKRKHYILNCEKMLSYHLNLKKVLIVASLKVAKKICVSLFLDSSVINNLSHLFLLLLLFLYMYIAFLIFESRTYAVYY